MSTDSVDRRRKQIRWENNYVLCLCFVGFLLVAFVPLVLGLVILIDLSYLFELMNDPMSPPESAIGLGVGFEDPIVGLYGLGGLLSAFLAGKHLVLPAWCEILHRARNGWHPVPDEDSVPVQPRKNS